MTIAIIGLGYVGIQLATAFGRSRRTIGFDLDRAADDGGVAAAPVGADAGAVAGLSSNGNNKKRAALCAALFCLSRALAQIAGRLRQPQQFTPMIDVWRTLWPDLEPVLPVLLRDILQQLQNDWPAIVAGQSLGK